MATVPLPGPLPPPNVGVTGAGGAASQAYAQYLKTLDTLVRGGNYPSLAVNGDPVLTKSNNLSDVASPATALANLGGIADPGAWTAYVPSVTPSTGTFSSVSATGKWAKLGKTIHFQVTVTITTNGTASGYFLISLPIAVKGSAMGVGRELLVTGKMVSVTCIGSSAEVINYDNGYPGVNGANIVISGTYETT